jgi:pilus assembly protein CpaB
MRLVFYLVLLIGVGIAGFAVYMANDLFNQDQAELKRLRAEVAGAVKLGDVVIAKSQLRYGQKLRRSDVRVVRWPLNAIPKHAFRSLDKLFGPENTEPRTVTRIVEPSEIILTSKVTDFGLSAGISSFLEPGMRAFTIPVDPRLGVAGIVKPGDRVDVNWTGRVGRETKTRSPLLDNVYIIAVDQNADPDQNRNRVARTVTVQVSPERAATLQQGQSTGKLTLTLRGATDDIALEEFEIDVRDITGAPRPVAKPQAPKKRECFVKVRKGGEEVRQRIDCPT